MKKKPDHLMELLVSIAENMKDCGAVFRTPIKSKTDLKGFSEEVKNLESKGDSFVHETIIELNHAFITSIEQEDILLLAEKMDEVVDLMEELAAYYYIYDLEETDDYMETFQTNIGLATEELNTSIQLLVNRAYKDIKEHTVNVKSYEEECDHTERKALRKLFKKFSDPVKLIQYKDLYEKLEDTMDACQDVAKALDTIVMKNM